MAGAHHTISAIVPPVLQANFTTLDAYTSPSWLSFSRAGGAMMTDSTGKLTWAPENLLTNSASLSTQSLTTTGTTAGELGTNYILSFTSTGSTSDYVTLSGTGSGTLYGNSASVTGGRVYLAFAATYGTLTLTVTGTVANAQLERVSYQTLPRDYLATTSSRVYLPRYDFDASTVPAKPRGLLIEESRANAWLYSIADYAATASWSTSRLTTSVSGQTAPDGTNTAYKIIPNAQTTDHYFFQAPTYVAGTATISIYAKAAGYDWVFGFVDTGANATAYFNVTTGVVGTVSGTAATKSASIQAVGNGWYRCTITATRSSTNTSSGFGITSANNTNALTGNLTSGISFWGAQFENIAAFATSYIPTTSASVTRAADVAGWTSAAFSSYWNATNGSIISEAQMFSTSGIRRLVSASDGTNNNNILHALASSGTQGYFEVRNSGVTNISASVGTVVSGSAFRNALAYKLNDYAYATNGSTVGTNTTTAVPTVTTLNIGLNGNSSGWANGWIRSFAYYNQRLPDAILKQKSTVGVAY